MAIHAAMIDIVDQEIGRVIKQLKKMKAFENTLILLPPIMEPVRKL